MISISRSVFMSLLVLAVALILSACGSVATEVTPESVVNTEAPTVISTVEKNESVASPTEAATVPAEPAVVADVSFSKDVMPLLEASCVKCHGIEKVSRGLNLTTYEKLMTGSVKGPVVVPGDAANSPLFTLVEQQKMPKQGTKLTVEQAGILEAWINAGALDN